MGSHSNPRIIRCLSERSYTVLSFKDVPIVWNSTDVRALGSDQAAVSEANFVVRSKRRRQDMK